MKVGLNLYSLRKNIATETGFIETCQKLKELGYSYLQFSGAKHSVEILEQVSSQILPIKLTHSPLDKLLNDTEELVKEHTKFGADYIGLGSAEYEKIKEYESALNVVEMLENIAVKIKALGKKFVYHNHNFEFVKYENGKTFFDLLIENTKELGFILDTYWVQIGGVNINEFVQRLNGRIECVHLKDFKVEKTTPRIGALGDGNINFKSVVEEMKKAGTKYFFVEQDDAETYEDPFKELEKSINYINKILG